MKTAPIATATLDTNVLPAGELVTRAERVGITVTMTTVSRREVEGTTFEEALSALESTAETGVYGESRFGQSVWGSGADAQCLERALALLSNGAFPRPANRHTLTEGQRRQLRDAMILCAHVRTGRNILVTEDRRAFVNHGRRESIAAAYGTRVMTRLEFERYVTELERANQA